MFTDQQKAKCVLYEFYESFALYEENLELFVMYIILSNSTGENAILRWSQKFKETG
jgi:hypothetical protein